MGFEPGALGVQGQGAPVKWAEGGSSNRRQIGPPLPVGVGLNVAGATNVQRTEGRQLDLFAVQAANPALGIN